MKPSFWLLDGEHVCGERDHHLILDVGVNSLQHPLTSVLVRQMRLNLKTQKQTHYRQSRSFSHIKVNF